MTSEPTDLYVWIWLPGATAPVVAGRAVRDPRTGIISFGYGRSYLDHAGAIALFEPDLPLQRGLQGPPGGHPIAPVLRDALPDRWGRRVIVNEIFGHRRDAIHEDSLGEMTYMMRTGSDRIGALDFQASATEHVARVGGDATLEDLQTFADHVEAGFPVPAALDRVIAHGSSIGGARPKALIEDASAAAPRKLIAKFSATNDVFAMVKAEFATMRLARRVGIDAARVDMVRVLGRDVLLVERFDRHFVEGGWTRRAVVSALTWTSEQEISAHHIAYADLAEIVRARFTAPVPTLEELFRRLVFNILVGNTDDHARNHAAFWDGARMTLTPAYDIAPQLRPGAEANQALVILPGRRSSSLALALEAAPRFLLAPKTARGMIDAMITELRSGWRAAADDAGMSSGERAYFEGRQILNAYAFDGYARVPPLTP